MACYIGGRKIRELWHQGRKVREIWFMGRKIYESTLIIEMTCNKGDITVIRGSTAVTSVSKRAQIGEFTLTPGTYRVDRSGGNNLKFKTDYLRAGQVITVAASNKFTWYTLGDQQAAQFTKL